MTYILFARWFGIISLILALGILFNLEDAQKMANEMLKSASGYIMGGVLPIIFGTLAMLHQNSFTPGWELTITLIGLFMLLIGTFRVLLVDQWRAVIHRHLKKIPFLFSLFGLMLAVIMLYVGFLSSYA